MEARKKAIYSCLVAIFFSIIFLNNSGDPPNGRTGAPGDSTCNGCHGNPGSQSGTVEILGLVDDPILPNTTYNLSVEIALTGGISNRAGFQMVVLDGNTSSSPSAGTLVSADPRVVIATSGNRQYAEHSPEYNWTNDTVTYAMDWTSPSSADPTGISFYAIALLANQPGSSGDVVLQTNIQNRALPVIFADFSLQNMGDQVLVKWSTEKELNSDRFELLRSTDTKNFEMVAEFDAAGQSNELVEYEFLDEDPPTNRPVYYKIRQIDYDGSNYFTSLKSIIIYSDFNNELKLFPNPLREGECLFAEIVLDRDHENIHFEVINQFGQKVFESNDRIFSGELSKGFNKLVVDTHGYDEGMYMFNIWKASRIFKSGAFVVTK